jgi:hypothetical protein
MMDNNYRAVVSGNAASPEPNYVRVAEDCERVAPESDLENSASSLAVEDAATNFRELNVASQQHEEPDILECDEGSDHIMDLARYLHNAHIEPQFPFG